MLVNKRLTFKEFAAPLLEMPYFIYGEDGIDKMYDFRIEDWSLEQLEAILTQVFNGIASPPDKDGKILHITTPELKQKLIDYLTDLSGLFILNAMVKYNSQINPVIQKGRMPTKARKQEEIQAYMNWLNNFIKKSKASLK